MSSQNKATPKKGGWGSMLSSAVAGLESRLDTILADGPEAAAAAKAQATDDSKKTGTDASSKAPVTSSLAAATANRSRSGSGPSSRDASRTRGNDRLAERLARATAQKSAVGGIRSRAESPAKSGSARASIEISKGSAEIVRDTVQGDFKKDDVKDDGTDTATISTPEVVVEKHVDGAMADSKPAQDGEQSEVKEIEQTAPSTLLSSSLPINPARQSVDSGRPSVEMNGSEDVDSSRPSIDALPNGSSILPSIEAEAEMEKMRADHENAEKQRQEEMHGHLERIDALQAKLQYLAKETVAAARQANASVKSGTPEAKLAEKDEQIALLMEEGQQLSKTELRHLQTIKKLRAKGLDDEKVLLEMRKKLDKAERSEMEQKHKVRRAEVSERAALDRCKQIPLLEKQLDDMRNERDGLASQIKTMTVQLEETEKRASKAVQDAHSKALEAERSKIADLENELEDSQIEKKLAGDRAQAEIKKVREDADRQRERWAVTELEMDNEIKSVEARLEAMRARAEEASTEADGAESSAKLLRQIELLQNQYNLAKTNWETIESSLNARLVAIEKDRDEVTRREAEIRKKARDAASKARKHAEEVELGVQQIAEKDAEIQSQSAQIETLQRNAQEAEVAIADVKADFERQRRIWESELNSKIEEEKTRWQQQRSQPRLARNDSSTVVSRKTSGVDIGSMRKGSAKNIPDLSVHPGLDRSFTRRSSAAIVNSRGFASPDREILSPSFNNMEGALTSLHDNGIPPTPTIEADDDEFDRVSSPQQTINDIVSTNVSGAGPTVQLVERMSAAVRRLEGEKAARKDELALVASQRDEARDQIVLLMREVEDVRNQKARTAELEKDLSGVQQRYDACLEMLGEREEEVDELKADVVELKKIYRELVQEKVGG